MTEHICEYCGEPIIEDKYEMVASKPVHQICWCKSAIMDLQRTLHELKVSGQYPASNDVIEAITVIKRYFDARG